MSSKMGDVEIVGNVWKVFLILLAHFILASTAALTLLWRKSIDLFCVYLLDIFTVLR